MGWNGTGTIIVSVFLPDWKYFQNVSEQHATIQRTKARTFWPLQLKLALQHALKFFTSQRILLFSENVPNLNFTCGAHLNANQPISNLKVC